MSSKQYSELEQKLARAILQSYDLYERSYVPDEKFEGVGTYAINETEAMRLAFHAEGLPDAMSYPFYLANHWDVDLTEWCKEVLSGKEIFGNCVGHSEQRNVEYVVELAKKLGIEADANYSLEKFEEKFGKSEEVADEVAAAKQ